MVKRVANKLASKGEKTKMYTQITFFPHKATSLRNLGKINSRNV